MQVHEDGEEAEQQHGDHDHDSGDKVHRLESQVNQGNFPQSVVLEQHHNLSRVVDKDRKRQDVVEELREQQPEGGANNNRQEGQKRIGRGSRGR